MKCSKCDGHMEQNIISGFDECIRGCVPDDCTVKIYCDICGDMHDIDCVPLSCQTGDGE